MPDRSAFDCFFLFSSFTWGFFPAPDEVVSLALDVDDWIVDSSPEKEAAAVGLSVGFDAISPVVMGFTGASLDFNSWNEDTFSLRISNG